jgi:hypothetical protein
MVKLNKKTIIKLSAFILVFAATMYFMYAYGWMDLFTDMQRLIQFTKEYKTEQVYNQKRLHASLDYVPPVEYKAMLINLNQKAPCPITLS